MIDTDPSHVQLQPENAIVLPKWKGEASDKGLVAMIPFLEYLAMMAATGQPVDVRKVLESMKGKDIPVEYARREAKLREAKEELFNLRFQAATGQLESHGRLRLVKKDIARIYTVVRERELGIRTAPGSSNEKDGAA